MLAALMAASALGGCAQSSTETSSTSSASTQSESSQSSSETSSEESSESSGEQVELFFYVNPMTNNSYALTAAEFEEQNPNIKITLVETPSNTTQRAQYLSTVLQAQDSNMDVFFIDCTWPSSYYASGWVEPLNDLFTEDELSDFLPGPIEANTVDGTLCSIPLYIDAGILLYRTDLLEKYNYEPPKTWEELIEQSKTIMAGEPEIVAGYTGAWKQAECMVCCANEFMLGYGGGILDENGNVILNSEGSKKGLQTMADMIFTHKITEAGITGYIESDARILFNAGSVVFLRDWPSGYAQALDPDDSAVYDKVDFAPVPAGSEKQATTLGGWSLAVSPFSLHKEEAKEFLKYMTGVESAKREAILNTRLPARQSVYEDPEVLEANPNFGKLQECAANVSGRPKTAYYEELSAVIQQGVSSILAGSSSVEDAVNSMTPQIESIINQ